MEQKLDAYRIYDQGSEGEYYTFLSYSYMMLGNDEAALKYLRKATDANAPNLTEIYAEMFPNVKADELYDYYYYKVYGRWPER